MWTVLGQMDIRKPGAFNLLHIPLPKLGSTYTSAFPMSSKKGPSKIFNKVLAQDYWIIIQFLATLKALLINSKIGFGSKRNPLCVQVGGSLELNSLSFLPAAHNPAMGSTDGRRAKEEISHLRLCRKTLKLFGDPMFSPPPISTPIPFPPLEQQGC